VRYFLARAELGVLHAHAGDIDAACSCPELIEYDAGAMRAWRSRLIEEGPGRALPRDGHPEPHLQARVSGLRQDYPHLDVQLRPHALEHRPLPCQRRTRKQRDGAGLIGGHAWSRIARAAAWACCKAWPIDCAAVPCW
jgi:hypothetical protein